MFLHNKFLVNILSFLKFVCVFVCLCVCVCLFVCVCVGICVNELRFIINILDCHNFIFHFKTIFEMVLVV